MWEYMEKRVRAEARYILETGCTVRACAAHFGTSKSTVHKDVTERLQEEDAPLCARVRAVLEKNLSERHLRGGEATRRKYLGRPQPANGGGSCADAEPPPA